MATELRLPARLPDDPCTVYTNFIPAMTRVVHEGDVALGGPREHRPRVTAARPGGLDDPEAREAVDRENRQQDGEKGSHLAMLPLF